MGKNQRSRIFYQKVDKRSREAMVRFLTEHFRYHTANSWNRSTSYAHNLKIHNLRVDRETEERLYSLIQCEEFYLGIEFLIGEFGAANDWRWQAGFNGRSGGYLVLYQGSQKPSGYKSYCPSCGQRNYTSVTENSGNCGVCKNPRRDYSKTHMEISVFPGRGTDEGECFEDWDMDSLRERVELVQSFDRLADSIVAEAIYQADNFEIGEEEYTVTKTRPVLVARKA